MELEVELLIEREFLENYKSTIVEDYQIEDHQVKYKQVIKDTFFPIIDNIIDTIDISSLDKNYRFYVIDENTNTIKVEDPNNKEITLMKIDDSLIETLLSREGDVSIELFKDFIEEFNHPANRISEYDSFTIIFALTFSKKIYKDEMYKHVEYNKVTLLSSINYTTKIHESDKLIDDTVGSFMTRSKKSRNNKNYPLMDMVFIDKNNTTCSSFHYTFKEFLLKLNLDDKITPEWMLEYRKCIDEPIRFKRMKSSAYNSSGTMVNNELNDECKSPPKKRNKIKL